MAAEDEWQFDPEYEPSDPDDWEDYDPDAIPEDDELEGFEVYESADDYLMKYVNSVDDEEGFD